MTISLFKFDIKILIFLKLNIKKRNFVKPSQLKQHLNPCKTLQPTSVSVATHAPRPRGTFASLQGYIYGWQQKGKRGKT